MDQIQNNDSGRQKALLDTNVFNDLLDNKVTMKQLEPFELFATHVQLDEIRKTPDEIRKVQLLTLFKEMKLNDEPTTFFVLGFSRLGQARIGDGKILSKINMALRENSRHSKKALNDLSDAAIAETAIIRGMILITADERLAHVVKEFGGNVVSIRLD